MRQGTKLARGRLEMPPWTAIPGHDVGKCGGDTGAGDVGEATVQRTTGPV